MFKEEFPSSAQKRAATRVIDAWGIPSTCATCLRSQHLGPCEEEDSEIIEELPDVLDQLTGNRSIVTKIKAAYGPEESAVTINASFFATNDAYYSSQEGNDYIGSDFSDLSQSSESQSDSESSQTQSDRGSSRSNSQSSARASSPPHSDGHRTDSDQ
jgi:CRISPR/Cas system-associated protein Cas10 (large subunit of type III CRISPR-Cas system)